MFLILLNLFSVVNGEWTDFDSSLASFRSSHMFFESLVTDAPISNKTNIDRSFRDGYLPILRMVDSETFCLAEEVHTWPSSFSEIEVSVTTIFSNDPSELQVIAKWSEEQDCFLTATDACISEVSCGITSKTGIVQFNKSDAIWSLYALGSRFHHTLTKFYLAVNEIQVLTRIDDTTEEFINNYKEKVKIVIKLYKEIFEILKLFVSRERETTNHTVYSSYITSAATSEFNEHKGNIVLAISELEPLFNNDDVTADEYINTFCTAYEAIPKLNLKESDVALYTKGETANLMRNKLLPITSTHLVKTMMAEEHIYFLPSALRIRYQVIEFNLFRTIALDLGEPLCSNFTDQPILGTHWGPFTTSLIPKYTKDMDNHIIFFDYFVPVETTNYPLSLPLIKYWKCFIDTLKESKVLVEDAVNPTEFQAPYPTVAKCMRLIDSDIGSRIRIVDTPAASLISFGNANVISHGGLNAVQNCGRILNVSDSTLKIPHTELELHGSNCYAKDPPTPKPLTTKAACYSSPNFKYFNFVPSPLENTWVATNDTAWNTQWSDTCSTHDQASCPNSCVWDDDTSTCVKITDILSFQDSLERALTPDGINEACSWSNLDYLSELIPVSIGQYNPADCMVDCLAEDSIVTPTGCEKILPGRYKTACEPQTPVTNCTWDVPQIYGFDFNTTGQGEDECGIGAVAGIAITNTTEYKYSYDLSSDLAGTDKTEGIDFWFESSEDLNSLQQWPNDIMIIAGEAAVWHVSIIKKGVDDFRLAFFHHKITPSEVLENTLVYSNTLSDSNFSSPRHIEVYWNTDTKLIDFYIDLVKLDTIKIGDYTTNTDAIFEISDENKAIIHFGTFIANTYEDGILRSGYLSNSFKNMKISYFRFYEGYRRIRKYTDPLTNCVSPNKEFESKCYPSMPTVYNNQVFSNSENTELDPIYTKAYRCPPEKSMCVYKIGLCFPKCDEGVYDTDCICTCGTSSATFIKVEAVRITINNKDSTIQPSKSNGVAIENTNTWEENTLTFQFTEPSEFRGFLISYQLWNPPSITKIERKMEGKWYIVDIDPVDFSVDSYYVPQNAITKGYIDLGFEAFSQSASPALPSICAELEVEENKQGECILPNKRTIDGICYLPFNPTTDVAWNGVFNGLYNILPESDPHYRENLVRAGLPTNPFLLGYDQTFSVIVERTTWIHSRIGPSRLILKYKWQDNEFQKYESTLLAPNDDTLQTLSFVLFSDEIQSEYAEARTFVKKFNGITTTVESLLENYQDSVYYGYAHLKFCTHSIDFHGFEVILPSIDVGYGSGDSEPEMLSIQYEQEQINTSTGYYKCSSPIKYTYSGKLKIKSHHPWMEEKLITKEITVLEPAPVLPIINLTPVSGSEVVIDDTVFQILDRSIKDISLNMSFNVTEHEVYYVTADMSLNLLDINSNLVKQYATVSTENYSKLQKGVTVDTNIHNINLGQLDQCLQINGEEMVITQDCTTGSPSWGILELTTTIHNMDVVKTFKKKFFVPPPPITDFTINVKIKPIDRYSSWSPLNHVNEQIKESALQARDQYGSVEIVSDNTYIPNSYLWFALIDINILQDIESDEIINKFKAMYNLPNDSELKTGRFWSLNEVFTKSDIPKISVTKIDSTSPCWITKVELQTEQLTNIKPLCWTDSDIYVPAGVGVISIISFHGAPLSDIKFNEYNKLPLPPIPLFNQYNQNCIIVDSGRVLPTGNQSIHVIDSKETYILLSDQLNGSDSLDFNIDSIKLSSSEINDILTYETLPIGLLNTNDKTSEDYNRAFDLWFSNKDITVKTNAIRISEDSSITYLDPDTNITIEDETFQTLKQKSGFQNTRFSPSADSSMVRLLFYPKKSGPYELLPSVMYFLIVKERVITPVINFFPSKNIYTKEGVSFIGNLKSVSKYTNLNFIASYGVEETDKTSLFSKQSFPTEAMPFTETWKLDKNSLNYISLSKTESSQSCKWPIYCEIQSKDGVISILDQFHEDHIIFPPKSKICVWATADGYIESNPICLTEEISEETQIFYPVITHEGNNTPIITTEEYGQVFKGDSDNKGINIEYRIPENFDNIVTTMTERKPINVTNSTRRTEDLKYKSKFRLLQVIDTQDNVINDHKNSSTLSYTQPKHMKISQSHVKKNKKNFNEITISVPYSKTLTNKVGTSPVFRIPKKIKQLSNLTTLRHNKNLCQDPKKSCSRLNYDLLKLTQDYTIFFPWGEYNGSAIKIPTEYTDNKNYTYMTYFKTIVNGQEKILSTTKTTVLGEKLAQPNIENIKFLIDEELQKINLSDILVPQIDDGLMAFISVPYFKDIPGSHIFSSTPPLDVKPNNFSYIFRNVEDSKQWADHTLMASLGEQLTNELYGRIVLLLYNASNNIETILPNISDVTDFPCRIGSVCVLKTITTSRSKVFPDEKSTQSKSIEMTVSNETLKNQLFAEYDRGNIGYSTAAVFLSMKSLPSEISSSELEDSNPPPPTGLSMDILIYIIVGVVILILLIPCLIIFCLCLNRKKNLDIIKLSETQIYNLKEYKNFVDSSNYSPKQFCKFCNSKFNNRLYLNNSIPVETGFQCCDDCALKLKKNPTKSQESTKIQDDNQRKRNSILKENK